MVDERLLLIQIINLLVRDEISFTLNRWNYNFWLDEGIALLVRWSMSVTLDRNYKLIVCEREDVVWGIMSLTIRKGCLDGNKKWLPSTKFLQVGGTPCCSELQDIMSLTLQESFLDGSLKWLPHAKFLWVVECLTFPNYSMVPVIHFI